MDILFDDGARHKPSEDEMVYVPLYPQSEIDWSLVTRNDYIRGTSFVLALTIAAFGLPFCAGVSANYPLADNLKYAFGLSSIFWMITGANCKWTWDACRHYRHVKEREHVEIPVPSSTIRQPIVDVIDFSTIADSLRAAWLLSKLWGPLRKNATCHDFKNNGPR